jgi:large subunit ribosomal protein L21
MYAIVQTGGKQYRVQPGELLKVEKLDGEPGKEVALDVLWGAGEDGKQPVQKGRVMAEIVRQLRAPKVLVFKKRPKKGYKKMQGHRQGLTEIRIKTISLS